MTHLSRVADDTEVPVVIFVNWDYNKILLIVLRVLCGSNLSVLSMVHVNLNLPHCSTAKAKVPVVVVTKLERNHQLD